MGHCSVVRIQYRVRFNCSGSVYNASYPSPPRRGDKIVPK